jgi:hypothetical protein
MINLKGMSTLCFPILFGSLILSEGLMPFVIDYGMIISSIKLEIVKWTRQVVSSEIIKEQGHGGCIANFIGRDG